MSIPHGIPAKDFIDYVNMLTGNESKRCRILLAELLLRIEQLQHPLLEVKQGGDNKESLDVKIGNTCTNVEGHEYTFMPSIMAEQCIYCKNIQYGNQ